MDRSFYFIVFLPEYSLSLYYRHTSDPEATHRALLSAIAQLDPAPRQVVVKFVENLIPQRTTHKGDALLQLLEYTGYQRPFFWVMMKLTKMYSGLMIHAYFLLAWALIALQQPDTVCSIKPKLCGYCRY
jgi:hypothetical protein